MKTIEYSISEADAVRHLIMCDTQFTWAGVTNLTMPQMMDLQARGWVVEGAENDEFQLTEAGEAVVARALQHGVPKTLADVQPGGRVRLGDQLVLAKLVGAAGLMLAEIDTCGHEVDPAYRRTLYEAWEEGKAALSAQPSPGGQDAARYERLFISAVEMLTKISLHLGLEPNSDGVEPMLAAIDALAARQPVGEPVAWMTHHDEPMLFPTAAEAAAYCEDDEQPVPLYAAPPAQAVDHHAALLAEERAHGEIIDQRDRYHEVADELAARIAAITGVDIGEHSSANCPWQNAIEAAEEYQPAQAVDLGRFREAVEGLKDAALHDRDPGPAVNAYNRVLALIDGKAVGK